MARNLREGSLFSAFLRERSVLSRVTFPDKKITASPNISRRGCYLFPDGTICAKHPGFGGNSTALKLADGDRPVLGKYFGESRR
jgi:hypothetical protein